MNQRSGRHVLDSELWFYTFLARRKFPKSYLGKIMLVAFLGTHIPLLTLFFYAIGSTTLSQDIKIRILAVALIATLVGTALTLLALQKLLVPITLTVRGLRQYLEKNQAPHLPTQFTDEVGILMSDTLYTIDKLDESIQQLKNYDPLTALPNRMLFQARLQQAIAETQREHSALAVMLLDLDGFAALNNSLGYDKGDWLLRQVAQRLTTCVRDVDLLARVGSDEFAVLHPYIESIDDLTIYSQYLLNVFSKPFFLGGSDVYLAASIGIALYPIDQSDTEQLMPQSDVALRLAKEQGGNTYRFYSTEMNEKLRRRLELERDLRGALERKELELFYQPQIDLRTGNFTGAEALLRWRHPRWGFVSPAEFIPIAESSGLILSIGNWVIHTACTQNKAWLTAGFPELCVAVNLSVKQFQQSDLITQITNILEATDLKPAQLELEITESLLMEDVQKSTSSLQALHDLGLVIAIDDFGTGYSSLSYLKQFHLDFLKIDQSFIRGIPDDIKDTAITRSVITLAQSLQMGVIAEGVETQSQLDYLEQQGCYKMQGYYFSRPIPAADFTRLWEKQLEKKR